MRITFVVHAPFRGAVKRAEDDTAVIEALKPRLLPIGRFATLDVAMMFEQSFDPLRRAAALRQVGKCLAASRSFIYQHKLFDGFGEGVRYALGSQLNRWQS